MQRDDIDLIQRWLYHEKLSEQAIYNRINEYNVNIDAPTAIKIAKMQKQYEQGSISLDKLKQAYQQYNII